MLLPPIRTCDLRVFYIKLRKFWELNKSGESAESAVKMSVTDRPNGYPSKLPTSITTSRRRTLWLILLVKRCLTQPSCRTNRNRSSSWHVCRDLNRQFWHHIQRKAFDSSQSFVTCRFPSLLDTQSKRQLHSKNSSKHSVWLDCLAISALGGVEDALTY